MTSKIRSIVGTIGFTLVIVIITLVIATEVSWQVSGLFIVGVALALVGVVEKSQSSVIGSIRQLSAKEGDVVFVAFDEGTS